MEPKNNRIINLKNIMKIINSTKDFYIRKSNIKSFRCITTLLIMLFFSVITIDLSLNMYSSSHLNTLELENILVSTLVIGCISGLFIVFCSIIVSGMHKKLIINEFQSLLFSSAMRNNSEFFLIIDKNKNLIYIDENGYNIFGVRDYESIIDTLFENKNDLEEAIHEHKEYSIYNTMTINDNSEEEIKTILTPLARPNGFFMINGQKKHQNQA